MRIAFYILCILAMYIPANAQYVRGVVRDMDDNKYLQDVLVVNTRTQASTYTNDSGYYKLYASKGDTIAYMLISYRTVKKAADAGQPLQNIYMERAGYMLKGVDILPAQEKWEEEHKEMLKLYNKTFTDARRKPTTTLSAGTMAGITVDGLITEMAARISGQKKKDKRFLKDFEQTEEQKYIDLRYNPEAVIYATGTTYDSAVRFIYHHPMEVSFARDATPIEFVMWIRDNYRKWLLYKESPADSTNLTD